MIQCTAKIIVEEVRHICKDVSMPIKVQMTVGGITGERPDNQHNGAGGQPHQRRQRRPHRVQVCGDCVNIPAMFRSDR